MLLLNRTVMSEQEQQTILDQHLRGVTARLLWQGIIGWTSIVVSILVVFFELKSQINDIPLGQSKTDAIQDMRIETLKTNLDVLQLQIKDLNERFNELQSKNNNVNK
jgi:hypothetical protein